MINGNFKFKVIAWSVMLAGFLCTGTLHSAAPSEMTAPPETESAQLAPAQFKYGVYCKEKLKDEAKAYRFLELAAKQNHREAWIYLADCYFARFREDRSYLRWAKLCLMAAERLKADTETEFMIGLVEVVSGNLQGFKHWMKIAADKGHRKAAEMLADKKGHAAISKLRQQLDRQKRSNALKRAIDSHFRQVRQMTGTTGPEVLDQIAGRPAVFNISKMIRLPHPQGITLPGWSYDSAATGALIFENLMADRQGDMRWMTEEFKKQPLRENLLYPNPTIRAINATHEAELTKSLDKSGFKRCSKQKMKQLIKPFMASDAPEDYYDEDIVWSLGNDLYFRVHTDTSGRWMLRDYQFFLHKNGKTIGVERFPNPPDTADAALIAGIIQNNAVCWNNLAVKYADGKMDQVFRRDDEAEKILKELVRRRHAVGTYNLAVFYQNRGKADEAKKYFALAEKFAGSSVINAQVNLPEIFDRSGKLLVKNRLFRTPKQGLRIYTNGGRFAASLIGHIQHFGEKTGRDSAGGRSGIEEIIFRKNITHPVYLTMDSNLQSQLEKLIADIAVKSDPFYTYGVIVSSKGELVAAAQSSIFDLEKRSHKKLNPSEQENEWLFMPSGYVFPVPDQWMKLLNSSSYAAPATKEKLKLHIKQGVFSGEAQGVVLGINRMKGVSDPKRVSGQMATMMNYVCAYIGVAEKKAIPAPVVYTAKVNVPLKTAGNIEWISFYRPPDGIVVNALGVIRTADPQEKLYVCLRAVHRERNFKTPEKPEEIKNAAAKADKAEKILRSFPFAVKK